MSNPIKEMREEAGLSQAELADLILVSAEHVCRMEKGTKPITADIRAKLALVRIERMLDGNEKPLAVKVRALAIGWREP